VERDARVAAKLLSCVVSCCRGRIDRYIPHILQLATFRLGDAHTAQFRIRLLEVVLAAIYYDAGLIMELFRVCSLLLHIRIFGMGDLSHRIVIVCYLLTVQSDLGATEMILNHLFNKLPSMTNAGSQRLIVLGFSRYLIAFYVLFLLSVSCFNHT